MTNAFSKAYTSQQKRLKADIKAADISRKSTARREAAMASDDPNVRIPATGFIPGMGNSEASNQRAEKIRRENSKV